jgi:hypothetical protein
VIDPDDDVEILMFTDHVDIDQFPRLARALSAKVLTGTDASSPRRQFLDHLELATIDH